MVKLVLSAGLFALTLLSLQGTIYLLQLVSAAALPFAEYGAIRIVDSYAAILSLLISFGLPSAALVKVSSTESGFQRTLVLLASLFATILLACALALALHLFPLSVVAPNARWNDAAWLIGSLTGVRLVLVSVAQARQEFHALALVALGACLISLITYFIAVRLGWAASMAWLLARCLLEVLVCAGWGARLLLARTAGLSRRRIAVLSRAVPRMVGVMTISALPLGASLWFRALADHGPVLWLAAAGAPAETISAYGIVLTLILIALVPSSIAGGVWVPRMAERANRQFLDRKPPIASRVFLLAVASSLIMLALLRVVPLFVEFDALLTGPVVTAGLAIVGFKALASLLGGYLLANDRGIAIFLLNTTTLIIMVAIGACSTLWPAHLLTLGMVVGAVAIVESIAAGLYILVAFRIAARSKTGQGYLSSRP